MLKLNINYDLLNDIQAGLLKNLDKIKLKNKSLSDDVMLTYKFCLSQNPEIVNVDYGSVFVVSGIGIDYLKTNTKFAWNKIKGKNDTFTLQDSKIISKYAQDLVRDLALSKKSEMNKVVSIYDYLSETVTYEDSDSAHDAWGALIDKKAVCEGISYAFCLLTKKCGVDSVVVSGKLKGQPHAWNMVTIEDIPYHLDITSNLESKKNGANNYDYIFLNDTDLIGYEWDRSVYPACNSNKHNYFLVTNSFADNEEDALKIILRQLDKHRIIYFRCSDNMNLNKTVVQNLFIKSCAKTKKFYSSMSILINPRIRTVQIIYK